MPALVLDNNPGPALDIVLLNAGAAIYVAGLAPDMEQGIELARAGHCIRRGNEKVTGTGVADEPSGRLINHTPGTDFKSVPS